MKNALVHYQLVSINTFRATLYENERDLMIVVLDPAKGTVIEDAEVLVKGHTVPYDATTGTYLLRKASRRGLVTIKHNGEVRYLQLSTWAVQLSWTYC